MCLRFTRKLLWYITMFPSFYRFSRLRVICTKLRSLKGRDPMERIRIHWKNQKEILQMHLPKQERVERQARVQAMMAFHKGLASRLLVWECVEIFTLLFSFLIWISIPLNSGESGSEGSSNGSDENQQVCDRLSLLHVLLLAFSK